MSVPDPVREIQSAIERSMCRVGQPDLEFITEQDLKRLWKEKELSLVLDRFEFSLTQLTEIQIHYIKVLSILIVLDFTDSFKELYLGLRKAGLNDIHLPLAQEQLRSIWGSTRHRSFFKEQYAFCPLVIEDTDNAATIRVDARIRLPFEKVELIAEGGFGDVDRVTIPPHYILPDQYVWDRRGVRTVKVCKFLIQSLNFLIVSQNPRLVSCKVLKSNFAGKRELENIKILKSSISSHGRIVTHLAAILQETNFIIIFPHSRYGDLRGLLYGDKYHSGTALLFESLKDLNVSDYRRQRNILSEIQMISDALRWLHHELLVENSLSIVFSHKDLKPANILIDGHPEHLMGKWCLSDFGISAFDEETGEMATNIQPVGGATQITQTRLNRTVDGGPSRPTMREPAEVEIGAYQAPEVIQDPHIGSRRSDVWSLVCIFTEVLAFVLGGTEEVKSFKDLRQKGHNDSGFFRDFALNSEESSYVPGLDPSCETCVRPSVDKYLEELPQRIQAPGMWVECSIAITRKYLVPQSAEFNRPHSDELRRDLKHVIYHYESSVWGREREVCEILYQTKHCVQRDAHELETAVTTAGVDSFSTRSRDNKSDHGSMRTDVRSRTTQNLEMSFAELQTNIPRGRHDLERPHRSSCSGDHRPIQNTPSERARYLITHEVYKIDRESRKTLKRFDLSIDPSGQYCASLATNEKRECVLTVTSIYSMSASKDPHSSHGLVLEPNCHWKGVEIAGIYALAWGLNSGKTDTVVSPSASKTVMQAAYK